MTAPLVAPPPGRVGPQPAAAPRTSPPTRPDLHVVEVARHGRAGIYGAITVAVIFGTLFLNAGFHTVLVSGQQRLDSLNDRVVEAEKRNQSLRLEVAGLESPGRIVEAAQRDAMVLPSEVHWLSPGPDPRSAVASTSERVAPTTTAASPAPGPGGDVAAAPPAGGTPNEPAASLDAAPLTDGSVATDTEDR
ncbi:MAG: hypothetical protein WKF43_11185 [Acidimicrobiales bacterium]